MRLDAPQLSGRLPALAALLIALGAAGQWAAAQAPSSPVAREDARAQRLAEMKQIAASFQAATIDGGSKKNPAALTRDPLYRWTDPTRENSDGTLWAWRSSGRPIAVLAIELYPQNKAFGPVWRHRVHVARDRTDRGRRR